MINLIKYQEILNLQWVSRLYYADENENWTLIPKWHLKSIGKNNSMFFINCRSKELGGLNKVDNIFWKQIWITYADNKNLINMTEIDNKNYRMQPLFNNSLVKYRNKIVHFETWIKQYRPIQQVRDLIHTNENRLLSMEEVVNLVGQNRANTIFQYNAIVNAIP